MSVVYSQVRFDGLFRQGFFLTHMQDRSVLEYTAMAGAFPKCGEFIPWKFP
jgi:hypothetical protein